MSAIPPGTGRLGIVRTYFDILAVLGAIGTTGLLVLVLRPSLVGPAALPNPWLSVLGGAAFSWGALQTSRMLRNRRRVGALAAAITFGASLISASHAITWITPALSLAGLALLASVWDHLE
jgi:hypothetical protein